MTKAQKIQNRLNEIRARTKEISKIPDASMTDELRSEFFALETERTEKLDELEKALTNQAQDAGLRGDQVHQDGAFSEMQGVIAQFNTGEFMANLFEKRGHDGAIAEAQAHYNLGRNDIPIDVFRGVGPGGVMAAVTPGPSNVGRTEQPTLLPVFAMGDGRFFDIDNPVVDSGDAVFPVMTTRPSVGGPHTDSTSVDETTGAFDSEVLQPSRIQASQFYRRTAATRFPSMGADITSAIGMGLVEKLDAETVAGIVADVKQVAAVASAETFATYRKRLVYDRIDGRFAKKEGDIKILWASDTLSHASGLYRGNTADDSAVDSLRRVAAGVEVSAHIAAPATNLQDVLIRRGSRRDMVVPVWRGVTIIMDEVTKAATGEIVITGVMQFAKKVIRTDGFARVQVRFAA